MKFLNPDWEHESKKHFWTAAIGAAISLYQGAEAKKKAAAAGAGATQSREERMALAQKTYDEYRTTFGPNEQALASSVDEFTTRDNLQKYLAEGTVSVEKAFDKSKDMQRREMGRYGINPASTRYQAEMGDRGLDRAKAEVGARVEARTLAEEEKIQDEDKLFSRRLATGEFGRTKQPGTAALTAAHASTERGFLGEEAGYAKQAGAGYGLAGKFIGSAINDYGSTAADQDQDPGGYDLFPGATGSELGEPVWEGSNSVSDADAGELGW